MWENWVLYSVSLGRYLAHTDKVPLNISDIIVSINGNGFISRDKVLILSSRQAAEKIAKLWNIFKDPLDYCSPVQIEKNNPLFISRKEWLDKQLQSSY